MKIEFICAYKGIDDYSKEAELNEEAWNKYMIEPYWNKISEWAFGNTEHLKPNLIKNKETVKKIIQLFEKINMMDYKKKFEDNISLLPKEDDISKHETFVALWSF